jgi:hypothetical protein
MAVEMGELGGGSWSAFGMGLRWRWGVGLRIIFGGKVENGVDSFFWTDPWLGEIPLSIRFLRLFKLSVNRWMTVADMFSLGWGEGGEVCCWQRRLLAWEEELVEECRVIHLISGCGILICKRQRRVSTFDFYDSTHQYL